MHHTGGRYENAAREMDRLLGLKGTGLRSYQCKMGDWKEIRE